VLPAAPPAAPAVPAATRAPTPALPTRTPATPDQAELARGLAASADAAAAAALPQARSDLALVKALMDRIKTAFFELGEALARLKQPVAFAALGYPSFLALCRDALGISVTKANELIAIATNMTVDLARGLGQKHALALVTLCKATPEDDTPEQLVGRRIPLPSGGVLDVDKASTREKREAAKELLAGRGIKGARTSSVQERAVAAEAQKRLRAAGLERARVQVLATRPGQPSDLMIDRVPVPALATLCASLCARPAAPKRRR
jgi:hypothetical protein